MEEIILHQVNCMGVMGAGFAKYVRDTFPDLYFEYKRICNQVNYLYGINPKPAQPKDLLGQVFIYYDENYIILNMFSQLNYGRNKCQTDYEAMEKALKYIRGQYPDNKITAPKYIGYGNAGGDWNIVSKLLEKYNISTSENIVFKK